MKERWARFLLSGYRVAGTAVYPFIGSYVAWRASKGKEDRLRRRERYGKPGVPRPTGPLIWVHAASVGETLAITPMVERLLGLGIKVMLTTGTVTSANVAKERFRGKVIHQYVPLDLGPAVSRFLDYWRPELAIVAESEIWPVTIMELARRHVPQLLVNGRMSDRSFAAWSKRQHVAEALFEQFAHVIAQSDVDGDRFSALGARPVTVSGNLKIDAKMPPVDERMLRRIAGEIGQRPVWAAVSTHDGEEALAANVHGVLKSRFPGLLTIVVPRHPERAQAIATMMAAKGLKVARRSTHARILPETDIFLGDTIGEMGLYLRLTEIAFVGRSLAATGGQNPLEPAMLGTAVLAGRNVQNFRDAYTMLIDAGAARIVADQSGLAKAVNHLLKNGEQRHLMMAAGVEAVEEMRGTLDRTMQVLNPFIQPLVMKARLAQFGGS